MRIKGVAYIQGGACSNHDGTPEFIENTVNIRPPVSLRVDFNAVDPPIGIVDKMSWIDGKLVVECEIPDALADRLFGHPKLAVSIAATELEMHPDRNIIKGGYLACLAVVPENSNPEIPPYDLIGVISGK